MTEKKLQVSFGNFLKKNAPLQSEVYELKITSQTSLAFDVVKDHQIENLRNAKNGVGIYHKISDAPIHRGMRTRFTFKKPFDCLYVHATNAFVVILFYQPRFEKVVYLIDVDDWVKEKESANRKSITEVRAREIATRAVSLKGF